MDVSASSAIMLHFVHSGDGGGGGGGDVRIFEH
jgi:hypothetical protein